MDNAVGRDFPPKQSRESYAVYIIQYLHTEGQSGNLFPGFITKDAMKRDTMGRGFETGILWWEDFFVSTRW